MNNTFDRFKDATWFPKEPISCIVGGAGGISSWLTFLLSRVGVTCFVYDFDYLETHNLGGQLFPNNGVGKLKVDVLSDVIKSFTSSDITTFAIKYDKNSLKHYIVFSGFDNMQARTDMFNNWVNYVSELSDEKKKKAIFIDGRLRAEYMQVLCVKYNKEDIEKYRNSFLFPDSDVEDGPCTLKQTSHAAAMIAGFMVSFFTNHLSNIAENNNARNIPFNHEYSIPLNMIL